jgi:hypothetical protein
MPVLTFVDDHGQDHSVQFAERDEIRLGADAGWSTLALPSALDIAPQHAIIARSTLNRLLLVVDLSGNRTWVNHHPVVRIRILRQGDLLQVGQCELTVWEVQITQLKPGDPAVGKKCPVSRRVLKVDTEVIACPGCGAVHERDAWFLIERCAAGCGYPNREVIMNTLPAWMQIERHLDQDSKLIERIENGKVLQNGQFCQAGQARDQVPFQKGQNAVYCPSCQTPFHLECFVTLFTCPVCQYNIADLINRSFRANGQP